MSLMAMLQAAQGGKLFSTIAESLDLDADQTAKAMQSLCPAIAQQLKAKAADDGELFQSLLDLIADGAEASPLEEPDAITGDEAVSDGNAILADIYGSRNAAMVALRKDADDVPERELSKLAPISATVVVAALAQANKPMVLAEALPAQGSSGSGIIGTIVGAVITGAVQGMVRELTSSRRWRSTTGYTKSRTKRKTSSSKTRKTRKSRTTGSASSKNRTTSASIEDIFRDILGNIGK